MPSLLLKARVACSLLAVPSVLLLFQSSDPGVALSAPSVEGFCSPLFVELGLILASWESWGLMKQTQTRCHKYSSLNFSPFSAY